MTYAEAEDFLVNGLRSYRRTGSVAQSDSDSGPSGFRQNLPTRALILRLLHKLGDPHRANERAYVHVAGTNGKGTTSTAIAAMCTAHGLRTGLYTSPHYIRLNERCRVDGSPIPEAYIATWVDAHHKLLLELEVSFFEAIAALAFCYFATSECDVVVLEVGMGGTWDATNVIDPTVSVITNISFDHTRELGHTLDRIAAEKAAVIKPGRPVIIGRHQSLPHQVFASTTAGLGSRLKYADECIKLSPGADGEWSYTLQSAYEIGVQKGVFNTSLRGPFVKENLTTAIAAFHVLMDAISPGSIDLSMGLRGLANLTGYGYMGRMQLLQHEPTILVDAGHNVDAWEPAMATLRTLTTDKELTVICGFKLHKDPSAFLRAIPAGSEVYLVQSEVLGATPQQVLAKAEPQATAHLQLRDARTLRQARTQALERLPHTGVLFVGGSSYLVGDYLSLHEASDPDD